MYGFVRDSYTYYKTLTILAENFFDSSDESFHVMNQLTNRLIYLVKARIFVLLFYLNTGQAFQGHNFWSI